MTRGLLTTGGQFCRIPRADPSAVNLFIPISGTLRLGTGACLGHADAGAPSLASTIVWIAIVATDGLENGGTSQVAAHALSAITALPHGAFIILGTNGFQTAAFGSIWNNAPVFNLRR